MPLTDAGAIVIAKLLVGQTQTTYATASARIGTGDSTTAFAKTQTDLQAATNKFRRPVDSGYPVIPIVGSTITFRATFGTSEGNYTWNEWGLFNAGPTGGEMLNRKVEALGGPKTTAQTWQFTVDLAIAA